MDARVYIGLNVSVYTVTHKGLSPFRQHLSCFLNHPLHILCLCFYLPLTQLCLRTMARLPVP